MQKKTEPRNAVMVGAGNRGAEAYGRFALAHPWLFRFVAVADPDGTRRGRFADAHAIAPDRSHADWRELLGSVGPEDLVFICSPDRFHYEQTMAFMERDCTIVLEKPVSVTREECAEINRRASGAKRRIVVCHVLRYTPFFSALKELLENRRIGRIMSINLQENIGYYHFAHSYVRGNWRNTALACPSILAKSSHDLDILYWLAGSPAEKLSSVGGLGWFRKENAPKDAPERCMDGCPAQSSCQWYAPNLYLTQDAGWPASVISDDPSLEARKKAIETGPYGRCVYRCDNDVADHQHVMIQFGNGITASFTLNAFTADITRVIQVSGSDGEIVGNLKEGWLELREFLSGSRKRIQLSAPAAGHSGGDDALMNDIAALFGSGPRTDGSRSRLEESMEGHWMAFAAEESRKEGTVVDMVAFRARPTRMERER